MMINWYLSSYIICNGTRRWLHISIQFRTFVVNNITIIDNNSFGLLKSEELNKGNQFERRLIVCMGACIKLIDGFSYKIISNINHRLVTYDVGCCLCHLLK